MLNVNDKSMEWHADITFAEILANLGYSISRPRVILRVDGVTIPKNERGIYKFSDGSSIKVVNTLCGG